MGFVEWDAGLSYKCGNSAWMCSLKEWRRSTSADGDVCTPILNAELTSPKPHDWQTSTLTSQDVEKKHHTRS